MKTNQGGKKRSQRVTVALSQSQGRRGVQLMISCAAYGASRASNESRTHRERRIVRERERVRESAIVTKRAKGGKTKTQLSLLLPWTHTHTHVPIKLSVEICK